MSDLSFRKNPSSVEFCFLPCVLLVDCRLFVSYLCPKRCFLALQCNTSGCEIKSQKAHPMLTGESQDYVRVYMICPGGRLPIFVKTNCPFFLFLPMIACVSLIFTRRYKRTFTKQTSLYLLML